MGDKINLDEQLIEDFIDSARHRLTEAEYDKSLHGKADERRVEKLKNDHRHAKELLFGLRVVSDQQRIGLEMLSEDLSKLTGLDTNPRWDNKGVVNRTVIFSDGHRTYNVCTGTLINPEGLDPLVVSDDEDISGGDEIFYRSHAFEYQGEIVTVERYEKGRWLDSEGREYVEERCYKILVSRTSLSEQQLEKLSGMDVSSGIEILLECELSYGGYTPHSYIGFPPKKVAPYSCISRDEGGSVSIFYKRESFKVAEEEVYDRYTDNNGEVKMSTIGSSDFQRGMTAGIEWRDGNTLFTKL